MILQMFATQNDDTTNVCYAKRRHYKCLLRKMTTLQMFATQNDDTTKRKMTTLQMFATQNDDTTNVCYAKR